MKNFRAEMMRYGVTTADVQAVLNCTDKTARSKINGRTDLTVSEAFALRDAFFPGIRLEYLYAKDDDDIERKA